MVPFPIAPRMLNAHHSLGTSIDLYGNTTSSATYSISLDGSIVPSQSDSSQGLLYRSQNLTNGEHNLTLVVSNPGSNADALVVFDRAVIGLPYGSSSAR